MKKILLPFLLIGSLQLSAQNAKYTAAMERNISMMDTARTTGTLQNVYNAFERISKAEPKEWLPPYYMAWLNIMLSMREADNLKKDVMLDKAMDLVQLSDSLSPDNSEVYALKAFCLSMKINIDPAVRGQKLGMESGMSVARAMKLDPENPRPYLLKGQSAYYTPPQYGGGKEVALPLLEQAVEKFKTFKPKNSLMPHWGSKRAEEMLELCKNMD